jgi:predicted DNA-binding protein (MmcQ/YjbR family)
MTKQDLIDYCLTFPAAYEDYPFDGMDAHSDDGTWTVMRHGANKKMFASIYNRNGKLCINLKCDPHKADFLRSIFTDVVPGWHMNKTHWNTVYIGGSAFSPDGENDPSGRQVSSWCSDVPPDEVRDMIHHSYDLIKPRVRKSANKETLS